MMCTYVYNVCNMYKYGCIRVAGARGHDGQDPTVNGVIYTTGQVDGIPRRSSVHRIIIQTVCKRVVQCWVMDDVMGGGSVYG